MAKIEFIGSLYLDDDGPVMPAQNIEASLIDAAKKLRRGPEAKAGIYCDRHAKIEYDGPRDAEGLWADVRFRNRSRVKVMKASIFRTRPIFNEWSMTIDLSFEDTILNKSTIIELAEKCGSMVGIGDWRPRYGRFSVAKA